MGKALKLKEKRREERENRQDKNKNKKALVKKSVLFLITGLLLFKGITLGYSNFPDSIKNKLKNITMKDEKNEAKSYKTGDRVYSQGPDMQIDINKKYIASFETNKGNFKAELFSDKAPKTVNNFVVLSKDKFYDGLIFHRIIKDFMLQGGDPSGDGTGGPGYKFEDETNDVQLVRGVLAMANSGPNTNGSQFFIITKENTDWLQGKNTAFAKITEGLDNVMKINDVETENDKPKEEVKIIKVTIEEK